MSNKPVDDVQAVEQAHRDCLRLREELRKTIVGQDDVVEQVLIAMLAGGHALLEGVPGVAKTLLVRCLAQALDLTFKRIQFTPDLMPSDITGADVIQEDPQTRERAYRFLPGPIFANLLLADEINRTPPKTQAAMLEAMQERQVSAGGWMHDLPRPFFVLATQNPLDHEGTYPLPEAQLDRFLLYIRVDYPSGPEEWEIARRGHLASIQDVQPCLDGARVLSLQELVRRVPISDQALGYAWALVRSSRPGPEAAEAVSKWVAWGAGPRGLLTLVACAKARAVMEGRFQATIEDLKRLAKPALRHRIAPNYAAQAEKIDSDQLIASLLEATSENREHRPQ